MQSRNRLGWKQGLPLLAALMLVAWAAFLPAANPKGAQIVPADDNTYEGLTYDQWSAAWWQWAFGQQYPEGHPLADAKGKDGANGQSGNVWFLGGLWWANNDVPPPSPVVRHLSIPEGTSLFFPIVNGENNHVEWPFYDPPQEEYDLELAAEMLADWVTSLTDDNLYCIIDGVPVENLTAFRATATGFTLTLPEGNALDAWGMGFESGGDIDDVAADGYFLMLKPMSLGRHTIEFGVKNLDWQMDIVYKLNVVPKAAVK